jgi:hypothetical protein
MNKSKIIIGGIVFILLVYVTAPIWKWRFHRWVNYSFDYKSQVKETVKDLVKKECLIDP